MPFSWKRLWARFSSQQPAPAGGETGATSTGPNASRLAAIRAERQRQERSRLPNTYDVEAGGEPGLRSPKLFEPALKQFPGAYRRGDPQFSDPEIGHAWYNARRDVLDHLLRLVGASPWKNHLVLRGSVLLKAWLGEAAREPGDIDWVFQPPDVGISNLLARELFDDFVHMASENPRTGHTVIDAAGATTDDIWTYERADGRRIVLPWRAEGLPSGTVQMDVVFGEELFADPIQTTIPSPHGGGVSVWSATKELSLAWKLLWLETDSYPQGKDLYDATLLAEQTSLPFELLYRVVQSGGDGYYDYAGKLHPDFPREWDVDWENFRTEYPWVEGEAEEWQARLTEALAPTFDAGPESDISSSRIVE